MKYKVLIIDDDEDLSFIMQEMLEQYGYQVDCATNSSNACEKLTDQVYDLILLDINLPDTTGFQVCEELRQVSTVPIIFASARTNEYDRINALELGGDAYLKKPYTMKELLASVNALIRRTYGFHTTEQIITFGKIEVNLTARCVKKNSTSIALSLREFDLLSYLLQHKNEAIRKETLLSEVWGAFSIVEPSTLTVHIRWLREKLEDDPSHPVYLKTVWGVGYILEVQDET